MRCLCLPSLALTNSFIKTNNIYLLYLSIYVVRNRLKQFSRVVIRRRDLCYASLDFDISLRHNNIASRGVALQMFFP